MSEGGESGSSKTALKEYLQRQEVTEVGQVAAFADRLAQGSHFGKGPTDVVLMVVPNTLDHSKETWTMVIDPSIPEDVTRVSMVARLYKSLKEIKGEDAETERRKEPIRQQISDLIADKLELTSKEAI